MFWSSILLLIRRFSSSVFVWDCGKLYLEMKLEWSVFSSLTPMAAFLLNLNFLLLYNTNRFHFAVPLLSYRSQKKSICGKNISDTLGNASCALYCSYHMLTSSVIYNWTDARENGTYLFNGCTREVAKRERSVRVTLGDSRGRLWLLECLAISQVHPYLNSVRPDVRLPFVL